MKVITIIILLFFLTACGWGGSTQTTRLDFEPAEEITLYTWVGNIPPSVIAAFTEEYGVRVNYLDYTSLDQAVADVRAGAAYDLVAFDTMTLSRVFEEGLLAEVDFEHIENADLIAEGARISSGPALRNYHVPLSWGVNILLMRTDLVQEPITAIADLWMVDDAGRVAFREKPRTLSHVLMSLGYSVNSTDPEELERAYAHLMAIKENAVIVGDSVEAGIDALESGDVVALYGDSRDVARAREKELPVSYVFPEEGTFMWANSLTIPANSPHKRTAELFMDFILRPKIAAEIVNNVYVAVPNNAVRQYVNPEILSEPSTFPVFDELPTPQFPLDLGPEGEAQHAAVWQRFISAVRESNSLGK